MNEELKERLKARIDKTPQGCWNYTRAKSIKGYGKLSAWGKMYLAHRLSFIVFKGKIPKGKFLDHLCRNPSCINPDHLEVVSNRENILRGIGISAVNSRKTHCVNGHRLSGRNLYVKIINGRKRQRVCKICNLNAWRRWYKRNNTILE